MDFYNKTPLWRTSFYLPNVFTAPSSGTLAEIKTFGFFHGFSPWGAPSHSFLRMNFVNQLQRRDSGPQGTEFPMIVLTRRSVVMRTLLEPDLNSLMITSRSFWSMSPCCATEQLFSSACALLELLLYPVHQTVVPEQRRWSLWRASSRSTSRLFSWCWGRWPPEWWWGFHTDHIVCLASIPADTEGNQRAVIVGRVKLSHVKSTKLNPTCFPTPLATSYCSNSRGIWSCGVRVAVVAWRTNIFSHGVLWSTKVDI